MPYLPARITLLSLGLLAIGFASPHTAFAAANVTFSPAGGQVNVGAAWATTVQVRSDEAVNSADITVAYPKDLLEVTDVSTGGTVFSIVLFQPKVDAAAGTIRFVQTSPSAFSGDGGKVGTISFKAKTTGTANVSIAAAKVIANDGKGTNVYSSGGTASLRIVTPPPPAAKAPTITSASHRDQNAWSQSREVQYAWTGGGKGYNFTVDQSPSTQLAEKSLGTVTNATTRLAADGIWYAHVRSQGDTGWSPTSHYRFQVDTAAPDTFQPEVTPKGDISVLPFIAFTSSDATSGVAKYEIQLDGGEWQATESPYKVPRIASGLHQVVVRASDKAGNTTEGRTSFTITPLETPVITAPEDKKLLMLGEEVKISGTAEANTIVELYLNDKKVDSVEADENGAFIAKDPLLLFAGQYRLTAKAINEDGIESPSSDAVSLLIDAKAVKFFGMVWPGWLFFGTIALVIIALSAGLIWSVYRLWLLNKRWLARFRRFARQAEQDLDLLERNVDTSIDAVAGAAGGSIKTKLAQEVDRVQGDLETAVGGTVPEPKKAV